MYRLTYFKATNVIGFVSGLSRKTVEIDLSKFSSKELIIIFGDNASGKSTFMSLVHPWHVPVDGRSKFIVPGKEGTVIRTYLGDDGTEITTKCVYSPKKNKEDGHNTKCYFSISKPGKDKSEELNPTGNLTSYQALLYTYFGLNKEFLGFATYNTSISSIVKQNDTERKSSVSTMIPNTAKFEVSYNIVNDRHRELRTLIRSVSDKILNIRDEDSIKSDLKRTKKMIEDATERWKESTAKLAKAEGRMKELTKGSNADDMIDQYNTMVESIRACDHRIKEIIHELKPLYEAVGLDLPDSGVGFESMDEITKQVLKYERRVASTDASLSSYQDRLDGYKKTLFQIENDIMEMSTTLSSIDVRDVNELMALKEHYQQQISEMTYAKHKDRYENMSYNEILSFSRTVNVIHTMIQASYDEHGELVTQYFDALLNHKQLHVAEEREKLRVEIETNNKRKDKLFREFVEKDQYRRFQHILDQRPSECRIDTCPFIANALKWSKIAGEVNELKRQYDALELELIHQNESLNQLNHMVAAGNDLKTLCDYIGQFSGLITKYFGISLTNVYESIKSATWTKVLDIMKLKSMAAILSEKDLYQKILEVQIPEVEHAIEMARMYGTNKQLIQSQLDRLKNERKRVKESIKEYKMHVYVSKTMTHRYKEQLGVWHEINHLVSEYKSVITRRIETSDKADRQISTIHQIEELKEKIRKHRSITEELMEVIEDNTPLERKLRMDLAQLNQLHIEKSQIEHEFLVIDILKQILMPGKGMRKDLINIYMYDIYQTANQLLLNTFNGNLYLKEFIITDKEFIIPYVYNGTVGRDINTASSSQQAAIAIAISMAILSKVLSSYGIVCFDEADAAFSPANREVFIDILTTQLNYIGIQQAFFITHHPEEYSGYPAGFLQFPGGKLKGHDDSKITV